MTHREPTPPKQPPDPDSAASKALPVDPAGLSSAEATRRRAQFGPNAVTGQETPAWRRLLAKFWAPVPWMLEAAIILQLALGKFVEALVIAVLVLFNALLGFVQEARARATLEALKSRLALMASVRRDGVWSTVPAAELVPGDLVKLSLGGIVPADVRLIEGEVLLDQSTLTGESLPVEGEAGRTTYAGALVRRGEALAQVTATGAHTRFGRTAELVRTAHGVSTQQTTVLRVVRNLAIFNGAVVIALVAYAALLGLSTQEVISLTLTAILAAIPVALPATFTLASALGARALAAGGVLPTRLSAVEEAATLDVLCSDKTGTITQNALAVTAVRPLAGYDEAHLLALAALASSEGGADPVDGAIRAAAAARGSPADTPRLESFTPFDPTRKRAEATAMDRAGNTVRIVKGAFSTLQSIAAAPPEANAAVEALAAQGFRVLAVAYARADAALQMIGFIALSDPPRADAAELIDELRTMGVSTVMITGDAPVTARVVASAVGLDGPVCPPGPIPERVRPQDYAVFAGVFPEDKFHIVRAFQASGHTVGMCGDGANDAPALRQAQMGIAVASATDVAKSAAGIVLTEPGLAGIVSAIREGRIAFQRILTYTLRSLTQKLSQMLLLVVGLVMTSHAILTPRLMALLMITGDFLAMSATTDHVQPSPKPNAWHVDNITLLGTALALCNLLFCSVVVAFGRYDLGLDQARLQTLSAVTLSFNSQALFYVVRERRRLWSSRPSAWIIVSIIANIVIFTAMATRGVLMSAIPPTVVAVVFAASIVFTFVLDALKAGISSHLKMQ
ncbi:MAG: plasma-membrane proton-efflux P-type ATPase [Steroidobacteraceae bacterium]